MQEIARYINFFFEMSYQQSIRY
nr:unnamed protein product [Callosobruchus analis]